MSDAPNPYANPAPPAAPLSPGEEKQWAILTHVIGIFFGAISAVVLFVMYRHRGPFVRAHTLTEFNFQLTILIVSALGFVLAFGSVFVSILTISPGTTTSSPPGIGLFFVGYFLVIVARIVAAILGIVAAVAANRGEYYKYPIAIPFAK